MDVIEAFSTPFSLCADTQLGRDSGLQYLHMLLIIGVFSIPTVRGHIISLLCVLLVPSDHGTH